MAAITLQRSRLAAAGVLYTHYLPQKINQTAAEVSAIGTGKGLGTMQLPSGYWSAGRRVKLYLKGTYQTPAFPGAVVVRIKVGSVLVAQANVAASLFAASSTTNTLFGEVVLTCQSVSGNAARMVAEGFLEFEIMGGTTKVPFSTAKSVAGGMVTPTSGTTGSLATVDVPVDTAAVLDVTETWSNAQDGQGTTITSGRLSETA